MILNLSISFILFIRVGFSGMIQLRLTSFRLCLNNYFGLLYIDENFPAWREICRSVNAAQVLLSRYSS
jgi:hypothetical protein